MKRNGCILLAALLFAGLAVGAANANMLANGGMEDADGITGQLGSTWPDGWTGWGPSGWHHNDPARVQGTMAIKMWWEDIWQWQDFTAIPGVEYTASIDVMNSTLETSGWDGIVKLEWFDANGTEIYQGEVARYDADVDPLDAWVTITGSDVAPEGVVTGRYTISLTGFFEGVSGALNFDNAWLGVGPPPSANEATDPEPIDMGNAAGTLDVLSWTNPDPNDPADEITCDVYFSADYPEYLLSTGEPNFLDYATLIVENQAVDSVVLSELVPAIKLGYGKDYYWRVDCYDPVGGLTTGRVWRFTTDDFKEPSLLVNGGFEAGSAGQLGDMWPDGWTGYGPSGWHHGDAGRVQETMAIKMWWNDIWQWQDFDATAGVEYFASIDVMNSTIETSGWDGIVKLEWWDGDWVLIHETIVARYDAQTDAVDEWVTISGSDVAPEGVVTGRYTISLIDWFEGVGGALNFDEAWLGTSPPALPNAARGPEPANQANVPVSLDELSWVKPDPNDPSHTILCDVYFTDYYPEYGMYGNDANFLNYAVQIGSGEEVDFVALPGSLVYGTTYYWRVDCYDPSIGLTEGQVWMFTANNFEPEVDAGEDINTWLTDGLVEVQFDATVSDDGRPNPPGEYTVLWTLSSGDAGAVMITDETVEDTAATITVAGTYEFTLVADDDELASSDTVIVTVLEDGCEAAKDQGVQMLVGDFNADCLVDMRDLAEMADNWLDCVSMDCP